MIILKDKCIRCDVQITIEHQDPIIVSLLFKRFFEAHIKDVHEALSGLDAPRGITDAPRVRNADGNAASQAPTKRES